MKERPEHNNPWTEKLESLPVPEAGESWQQMEAILDKEMPVAKTSWRWMYWLLSLLLLIGVCTCPGPWRNFNAPLVTKETEKRSDTLTDKTKTGRPLSADPRRHSGGNTAPSAAGLPQKADEHPA